MTDADSFEDNNGNNNGGNNGSNNGNNNQPSTPTGMLTAEQAKQKSAGPCGSPEQSGLSSAPIWTGKMAARSMM